MSAQVFLAVAGNIGSGKSTALAYLLLPEVLFYGLSALFIAILNMKGAFRPGAWAPVWNNVVQISTLVGLQLWTSVSHRQGRIRALVWGSGLWVAGCLSAMVLAPLDSATKANLTRGDIASLDALAKQLNENRGI